MTKPNNDEVICPKCCEQFRAIPVNVQHELETLRQRVQELEGYEAAWIETAKHRDRAERELAALKIDNGLTIAYMSGFRDGKKAAQKHGEPVLYACTKCGGANYACDCDSFRYCTKPLYAEPQTCFSAADMADAAAKAAQVEREECARLCDSLTEGFAATTTWDSAVLNCSQHIRMRGKGF